MAGSAHQAQEAAQRMADQKGRLAGLFNFLAGKVGQLLHQVRPVAGHGVAGVMAEFFNRLDLKTPCLQALEQHAVGAGRKAVAMGKNDEGLGTFGHGNKGEPQRAGRGFSRR